MLYGSSCLMLLLLLLSLLLRRLLLLLLLLLRKCLPGRRKPISFVEGKHALHLRHHRLRLWLWLRRQWHWLLNHHLCHCATVPGRQLLPGNTTSRRRHISVSAPDFEQALCSQQTVNNTIC